MQTQFYPFLFEPNLHKKVWGSESWEVSAVPTSIDIISNGPLKGHDLVSVINSAPKDILGGKVAEEYENQMPLLVKVIDANDNLSIQVHPDDAMAKRVCGGRGKTEMWYVLDAKPGAFLYEGFSRDIDETEFRKRVAEGTITDVLNRFQVQAGDAFYIPSGTIHALCGGLRVAEIQQSSDITYRIYDYGRKGLDGKPRALHIDLAAQALNFRANDNYKSHYTQHDNEPCNIIDSTFFKVRLTVMSQPVHYDLRMSDSFVIVMSLNGSCHIHVRATGESILLNEGKSAMIPAIINDFDIIPVNGNCKIIDTFV